MLTHYHGVCVAPYWEQVEHRVTAERELRVRILLSGGSEQLLRSLPGPIRWDGDALVADYPVRRDLPAAGRGLTLVPAFFCWQQPVSLVDADLPPVLVYPVGHFDDDVVRARSSGGLTALLGPTRARMRRRVAVGQETPDVDSGHREHRSRWSPIGGRHAIAWHDGRSRTGRCRS